MSEEVRQVQGVCESVLMRGDWLEFHIQIGRQYPVKLSTKKDEIKTLAQLAGQQMAVWTFTETEGNPNPHRPGEFFKNRYLSNVEVGGVLNPAYTQTQVQGQTAIANAPAGANAPLGHPSSHGREESIERQTIIKAVLGSSIGITNDDDDALFALLDRLDAWIAKPRVAPAATVAEQPPPHTDAEASPFQSDDDIPF